MRSLDFAVVATVLVSLLAVSECEEKSFIDAIIKNVLDKMRPEFADLKVGGLNENIKSPDLNASFYIDDIFIKNLDKFDNKVLQTKVLPLKLENLTLVWKEIFASAVYDIDVSFNVPKFNGPLRVHAKGDFKIFLYDVFFTTGANLEMKKGSIQIKPKGIFGFDVSLGSCKMTLSSVMGSPEFGKALGTFLCKVMPEFVDILKTPVFDAFQDDVIRIVNEILKGEKTIHKENLAQDLWNEIFQKSK